MLIIFKCSAALKNEYLKYCFKMDAPVAEIIFKQSHKSFYCESFKVELYKNVQ